ncbi:MAG: AI-2E family transporter [Ruminiclostridium sp.]|nr:AI-2E family transporter [Ruminiclostridium sp.]
MAGMRKKKIILNVLLLVIMAFAVYLLYKFRVKIGKIASPFFLAVLLTYIVKPLADKLERRKIPRPAAILAVYMFFILALAALGIFFIPELVNNTKELLNTLPEIVSGYQKMVDNIIIALKSSKWSPEIKTVIFNEMQNGIEAAQNYAAEALKKLLDSVIDSIKIVIDLTVAMVIAYYFVKDPEHFKALVLSLVPRRFRNILIGLGKEVNSVLSGFIQGQLLTALIVGILESIGLMIAGVKYPLILGMLGGLANIIPYFGPYIGAIPAVAVALTDSPLRLLWTVIVFIVVQQLDNSYISPKIIESKLGMHPVTTIFAVLVGGEFSGIIGMLLAVPVYAIIRIIAKKAIDAIAS